MYNIIYVICVYINIYKYKYISIMLENPEAETRWYFRYFLGQVHENYIATLLNGEIKELVSFILGVDNICLYNNRHCRPFLYL